MFTPSNSLVFSVFPYFNQMDVTQCKTVLKKTSSGGKYTLQHYKASEFFPILPFKNQKANLNTNHPDNIYIQFYFLLTCIINCHYGCAQDKRNKLERGNGPHAATTHINRFIPI